MTTTNEPTVRPQVSRIKIAIDLHKQHYRVVRQLDHTRPEPPLKLEPAAFYPWLKKQLGQAGEVVVCYEAGCFGYEPARRMQVLGARVLVIAPQNWDEAGKRQVNDKFDARVMCQRLSEYLDGHRHALSVVRIPTRAEEQRREVGRQRDQVRRVQRQVQAMGRSVLLRHEFPGCGGRWWRGRPWRSIQEGLPAEVVAQLRSYAALCEVCELEAKALEERLTSAALAPQPTAAHPAATAAAEPAAEEKLAGVVAAPMLFYGEGALTHELMAREIADPFRFKNPRAVGNYFGLCPSEHTSDEDRRLGAITKHGNPRLRCLLVELAWRVVFYQPGYRGLAKWREILTGPKTSGARKKKAIVALARQLAIDLWRVATGRRTLEELGLTRHAPRAATPATPSAQTAARTRTAETAQPTAKARKAAAV